MAKDQTKATEEQTKQPSAAEEKAAAEAGTKDPAIEGAEPKQAVITPADTSGPQPKRLRVSGFKGSYKGVLFDDEGVSAVPVSKGVADELRSQYPAASIEEID